MQGKQFTVAFHLPGTLAANVAPVWTAPFACQLVAVSAVASNDSDATLEIGISGDTDCYLDTTTIGDSGVPATFGKDDFEGAEYPHIAADTIISVLLDYDGSSGTAGQNVTIILWFTEG